ncbi:MAG TPA: hypothetical protein PKY76_01825 [Bacteroidales bacterium]|nr:hypothetical protein [Bacteroidales bacterium]
MKKVLLLEDRPKRQEQYLSKELIDKIKKLENVYMPLEEECRIIIQKLNDLNDEPLKEYSLIIIHRSSLSDNGRNTVTSHCKNEKKTLVFFSGGIGQSLFSFESFPYFLLNSRDFYKDSLPDFLNRYLKDRIEHISELIYGQNWKLNMLMSYRQILLLNNIPRAIEPIKESFESIIGKKTIEELNKEINKIIATI